jgi:hypothetical protein
MRDNFHRSVGGHGASPIVSHSHHHNNEAGGPVAGHTPSGKTSRAPGTSSTLGVGNAAQPAAQPTSRKQGGGSGQAPMTKGRGGKPSAVSTNKGSK